MHKVRWLLREMGSEEEHDGKEYKIQGFDLIIVLLNEW